MDGWTLPFRLTIHGKCSGPNDLHPTEIDCSGRRGSGGNYSSAGFADFVDGGFCLSSAGLRHDYVDGWICPADRFAWSYFCTRANQLDSRFNGKQNVNRSHDFEDTDSFPQEELTAWHWAQSKGFPQKIPIGMPGAEGPNSSKATGPAFAASDLPRL